MFFPSHSTATLLSWAIWRKIYIFFQKHIFFQKKREFACFEKFNYLKLILKQIWFIWRFWKNHDFFLKNPSIIFWRKPKVCKFWEVLLSQALSTASFLHLNFSCSSNNSIFCFERPIYFFKENSIFKASEIIYYSKHILQQLCYLCDFKKRRFFSENPSFSFEKSQIVNILKNPISIAFYCKFATFSDFW